MNIDTFYDLVQIPAPSFHEEKRLEYIKKIFKKYEDIVVESDRVNNLYVYKAPLKDNYILFSAHLDTVFGDEEISIKKRGNILTAPGIGDDTANVFTLISVICDMIDKKELPDNVMFLFNSCEEGLGNLLGINTALERLGDKVKCHIAFDLTYNNIINEAVGSVRYKVGVKTRGGHSYNAFGNTNAICVAANIINEIYKIDVLPLESHTTYNVGKITGGISVNTIADNVEFLYEVRSTVAGDMAYIDNAIKDVILRQLSTDVSIEISLIGKRPCAENVDVKHIRELTGICSSIIGRNVKAPVCVSGSTDCNASLSRGIPAICIGCYDGGDEHSYDEWVDESSLSAGYNICYEVISKISAYKL